MSVISYRTEEAGQYVRSSKVKHVWELSITGKQHSLTLVVSELSGTFEVMLDGKWVCQSRPFSRDHFSFPFEASGAACLIVKNNECFDVCFLGKSEAPGKFGRRLDPGNNGRVTHPPNPQGTNPFQTAETTSGDKKDAVLARRCTQPVTSDERSANHLHALKPDKLHLPHLSPYLQKYAKPFETNDPSAQRLKAQYSSLPVHPPEDQGIVGFDTQQPGGNLTFTPPDNQQYCLPRAEATARNEASRGSDDPALTHHAKIRIDLVDYYEERGAFHLSIAFPESTESAAEIIKLVYDF